MNKKLVLVGILLLVGVMLSGCVGAVGYGGHHGYGYSYYSYPYSYGHGYGYPYGYNHRYRDGHHRHWR